MFSFRTSPLESQLDKALHEGKVGCFCTQSCWDSGSGRYVYDIFRERGNLRELMMPDDSGGVSSAGHISFSAERLKGLSAVVVEIQDVGSRYFAYSRDVFRLMNVLNEMGEDAPALYVVDHINPAGRYVEGSMPDGDTEEFVPKIAHRHGLTLGELCNLYSNEIDAVFSLHLISCAASDSNRELLPWAIPPSPDISGMFSCYMYSGGALWEGTNISSGLGTSRPYEFIGAPFVKPSAIGVPFPEGVLMRPCHFMPASGMYAGMKCGGYQIMLLPGAEYHSLLHTLQLVRYFRETYPEFSIGEAFFRRLSDPALAGYVEGKISFQDAREHVKTEEQKWIRKARRFCLYDDPPVRIKK